MLDLGGKYECCLTYLSYRLLAGKPEGKRLLGRPRRTWVDNIKKEMGEIEWGVWNCIDLGMDKEKWRALVNALMNLPVL
jgi:hypothetical protein